MVTLFFFIPIGCILFKLLLNAIFQKYGKISYDGFSAAGFAYNSEKDIFYSTRNAWQKNFGYTHMYDVLAPFFRMIIDTEPVRFYYNNKNWLITFWKGQYGIVTGAEVGVYYTNQRNINKKTVYLPVSENEMLDMNLVLYKKGEEITRISAKHWWLAIFKLGMFSKPKDLTVDVSITFPNQQMLQAFFNSFKKLHHKKKSYSVDGNTFNFKFKKPRTRKVWTRSWLTDGVRQSANKRYVELYNKYLNDFVENNGIDDSLENDGLIMVNDLIPDLIKNAPENTEKTKEVAERIINEERQNVIFLDSKVSPGTSVYR